MKQLNILGVFLIIASFGLVSTNFVFPHTVTLQETAQVPYVEQVPYQTIENKSMLLEHVENYSISNSHSYFSYDLKANRNLIISWETNSNVIVFFMTESQYNTFISVGNAQNLKSQSGTSGSFSYLLSIDGKYYVVIYNLYWVFKQSKIVFYEANLAWQENVTEYRNETRYRTEYVSKEVNDNLYLSSGLVVAVLGIVLLIAENVKYLKLNL